MTDMFYLNPYKITDYRFMIRYYTVLSHCNRFFLLIVKSSLSESSLSVESVFEAAVDVGKSPPDENK